MLAAFVACQAFVVLFIALHDWIPLGSLNDVKAVRAADPPGKLVRVTILSVLPFAVGLAGCVYVGAARYPMWLMWLLWITYGATVYGVVRAWWWPYLAAPDPVRAERYRMFAATHTFLPVRNGMRPNTLHVIFHGVLLVLVVLLVMLSVQRG